MKKKVLAMVYVTFMVGFMTSCQDNSQDNGYIGQAETQTPETVPKSESATEKQEKKALLLEQNGITITYSGLEETTSGIDLGIHIENANNFTCTIQSQDVSVNGLMVNPDFSCHVAGGAKVSGAITITSSDLEINRITAIDEVQITFAVNDESDKTLFTSEPIVLSKIKKGLTKLL